jgi:peptide/nickel transport system ATP-binding protein
MYAGRIAEIGPVREIIQQPQHPYTVGLMGSIPAIGTARDRLAQIDGAMPRPGAVPPGCAFNPRCRHAFDRCLVERPELLPAGASRAACWLHATNISSPLRGEDQGEGASRRSVLAGSSAPSATPTHPDLSPEGRGGRAG